MEGLERAQESKFCASCRRTGSVVCRYRSAGGPGAPAPYIASGYLLFDTIEDFQGSFGPHTEKIMADIPNYTPVQPGVYISEITL